MSGIYIKGMEMPKCCYDCELIDIVTSCPLYDIPSEAYCQIDYIRKRRDKDCPLIELPPHGDLIDRDAMIRDIQKALAPSWYIKERNADMVKFLSLEDTIIPAEEGE